MQVFDYLRKEDYIKASIKKSLEESKREMSLALQRLAGVCDHASTRDDVGFNKPDAWTGHALASVEPQYWTETETALVYEVLRTYKNTQLPGFGLEFDTWAEPASICEETKAHYHIERTEKLAEEKREAAEAGRQAEKAAALAASRQIGYRPVSNVFILVFGGFSIKDPLFDSILSSVRGLPQRRWNGQAWEAAAEALNAQPITDLAARYSFVITESAAAKLGELLAVPIIEEKPFFGSIKAGKPGTIEINIPFSNPDFGKIKDAIKELPERRFDGERKLWIVPFAYARQVCSICAGFEIEQSILAYASAQPAEADLQEDQTDLCEDLLSKIDLEASFGSDGRTLRAHQQEGVIRMLSQRGTILADDMGLGKTATALFAALAHQRTGAKIIVVCPASLRLNWEKEAQMIGCIISTYSWAKIPEAVAGSYVLICDEAHYAQSLKSKRTKAMLTLAEGAQSVYLLTGTPIKNGRPANLYPLLAAVQHEIAYPIKGRHFAFVQNYCYRPNKWTPSGYDDQGAKNLDDLHAKTKDLLLRRLKKDCLDLPAKTRVIRKVEFSATAQQIYNNRLSQLRADYEQRIKTGQIQRNDAIVLLGQVRQAGSIAKTETAIELSEEIIEQGGSVVIFCEYKESTHIIAAALKDHGVGFITGDVNDAQVEQHKADFQAGRLKVLLCTFKRGGVGHTLTAASNVILVDRAWTPGDCLQSEDRLHRIGQYNPVTAHWLQANGTDEVIDQLLISKQERIDLVLAGKRKTLRGVDGSILEAAEEILAAIFG